MNTSQVPPGGWVWHEPSTGWWAPHPIGHTFDQQVQNIIKHRRANPAITAKHNLSLDPNVVGEQLIQYQQKRGALPAAPLPKLTPPPTSPHMTEAVKGAVAAVKKMAAGAALLMEWEEAGLPHVEQEQANSRAETCSKCPKNEKGKALTDIFTAPVAAMIKKKMERLDGMNLKTPSDNQLFTCQACLCPLRTKVWVGTDLILKRLKHEFEIELHESCWILKEKRELLKRVEDGIKQTKHIGEPTIESGPEPTKIP